MRIAIKSFLFIAVVSLSFLDAHFQYFLSFKYFMPVEILLISLTGYGLVTSIMANQMNKITFFILITFLVAIISGSLLNGLLVTSIGTVFLFKSLLAFIAGQTLNANSKKIRSVLRIILVLVYVSCIITILQSFTNNPFIDNPFGFNLDKADRFANGLFDNKNKNAQFLVFGYILSNFLQNKSSSSPVKFFFFAACIFLTGSRQALIVIVLVEIIIMYMKGANKFAVFLPVFIIFLLFTGFLLRDNLTQKFNVVERAVEGDYFRVKATIACIKVLQDYPLTGLGAGTFGGSVANVFGSKRHEEYLLYEHWKGYKKKPTTIDLYWPHLWAETGLIGLLLTIIIYILIIEKIKKNARIENRSRYRFINVMIISSLLFSFFSMNLESTHTSTVIFFLAGTVINIKPKEK